MTAAQYRKRVALAFSIGLHAVLFGALAASGMFAFLQSHAQAPLEVTVYNEDSLHSDESLGGGSGGGGGEVVAVGPAAPPEISETYTQEVAKKREVKKLVAQGLDAAAAEQKVSNELLGDKGKQAADDASTKTAGSPGSTSAQPGNGSDKPVGTGDGHGMQPPKRAVLVYSPTTGEFYPDSCQRKNIHGNIGITYTITTDGAVTNMAVTSSSGNAVLDDAAVQVVSQCRYEPATDENGQPHEDVKTSTVHF